MSEAKLESTSPAADPDAMATAPDVPPTLDPSLLPFKVNGVKLETAEDIDRAVRAIVGGALLGRRWSRDPYMWPRCVVVVAPPNPVRVVPRIELAAELRANDLVELARACTSRHVPPKHALLFVNVDEGTEFKVIDLSPRRKR